jgi:3-oxoacyl-[acyl-carrier protein] reductase
MELKDKVCVVTGASKGIGRATALEFASAGADVAIAARTPELLNDVKAEIKKKGVRCHSYQADLAQEKEIKEFISGTIRELGKIDILVNNAGFGIFHPVIDFPTKEWDSMFALNVRGLFLTTREALPHLRQSGKSVIVNVASLAGKNAFTGGAGYAATKHAVIGFSRCLMLEERKNGIRVLVICPGSVATSFFDAHHDTHDPKRDKILHSEDVAASIIHMIRQPQRAMVSEIDIRPTDPP